MELVYRRFTNTELGVSQVSDSPSFLEVEQSEDESYVDCERLGRIKAKPTSECSVRELEIRAMEHYAMVRSSSKGISSASREER